MNHEQKQTGPRGAQYWRSLAHLADSTEMREMIGKEFPGYDVDEMLSRESRRGFLKLAGASMALAGLTLSGCRRWPEEKLAPYSTNPRGRMPGVPEQYATAMEVGGVAQPLLVTSFDGRPIKIEGNPSHPFSWTVKQKLGATDAFAQASILDMYDPHRSRTVTTDGKDSSWENFAAFSQKHFGGLKAGRGDGLAIVSEATGGPSATELKKRFLEAFPRARWVEYEPINREAEIEGAKLAFGKPVRAVPHLDKAARVVLLDADVLYSHPAHVKYAADWSERRRSADAGEMSRVFMAETGLSITGSVADVRLPVDPARLYAVTRAIAGRVGVAGVSGDEKLAAAEEEFVNAAVADLKENGVVAGGGTLSPAGHALVHAINEKIGAVGKTVTLHEDPTADRPSYARGLSDLVADLNGGKVNTLLILGGNPAYDAPADLKFDEAMKKAQVRVRLGLYEDETSELCNWHLPRAHYLESWGDARAWDGTAGIVQPLIMPLFGGKSIIELLAMLSGEQVTDGHQIVVRTWTELLPDGGDLPLRKVIEAGLLEGSAYPQVNATVQAGNYPAAGEGQGTYLRFVADSHTFDGRYANNGWLQETPDPMTKLVWDNAALISKKDADGLGVETGDMIKIDANGASLQIAAYVMPGQPIGVIALPLGYARTRAGHIGDKLGFETYSLRSSQGLDTASGAKVSKSAGTYKLIATQDHYILDTIGAEGTAKRIGGRGESGMIVHEASFAEFKKNPKSVEGKPRKYELQLFEEPRKDGYSDSHRWGMSVDMNACIGCNACALACQAENNIPVVGKVQAENHRAMNWIRIDRYFKGDAEDPNIEVVHQPMMCQQCENAPCEQVCPVGATVHDSEGLNTMVYNRCIGTRYCSNNCPYKVRRFNYFDYHSQDPRGNWGVPYGKLPDMQQNEQIDPILRMVFNPDVSVRMRGVMEKCTYCVQRIHRATIAKRDEGGEVQDGDIVTACQQACPTQAIVFGNLNDRRAQVSRLHRNARAYGVLHDELDTRPRTAYLAKLRNPVEGAEEKKA
jgi:molybdopterin-containing oxidoreductase family iron-sulfur binding subunit